MYNIALLICIFIGDLTQHSFERKMARLNEKYSVASSTQEVVASPCSIASTLAKSPTIWHKVHAVYTAE